MEGNQEGVQLLEVGQIVRKSADGTSIDIDESQMTHRENEEDNDHDKEDADSDENENQIYYEPDEIELNHMKQKQDQFQDILHLRIAVADKKKNMCNIMDWMPKVQNNGE